MSIQRREVAFGEAVSESITQSAFTIGSQIDQSVSQGITENAAVVSGAAGTMSQSALSAINIPRYYLAGKLAAAAYGSGLAAGGGGVHGATYSAFGYDSKLGILHVRPMASGGLLDEGELFVAREAGAEMVGRIGRKTAVANNDQIVEGVASGVASGQSEQNALLRQQNEYLRQIASKKFSAEIVPSTALARVNRQSEQMRVRAEGGR